MVNRVKHRASTTSKAKKSTHTTKKKNMKKSPRPSKNSNSKSTKRPNKKDSSSTTRTLFHYFSPVSSPPSSQGSSSPSPPPSLPSPSSPSSSPVLSSPPSSPRSTIRNSSTSLNQFMNSKPTTPPTRDVNNDIFIHVDCEDNNIQKNEDGCSGGVDGDGGGGDTTTATSSKSKSQMLAPSSRPRTRLATLNSNVLANGQNDNAQILKKRSREDEHKEDHVSVDSKKKQKIIDENGGDDNDQGKSCLEAGTSNVVEHCNCANNDDGNADRKQDEGTDGSKPRGKSDSTFNDETTGLMAPSSLTMDRRRRKSSSPSRKKKSPNVKNGRKDRKKSSNALKLGLIRVDSAEATLQELCTSLYQNMSRSENDSVGHSTSMVLPTIYPLFKGAVLGRNERISRDPKKINIGIPINENGISRKQLIVSAIEWEEEGSEQNQITKSRGNSTIEEISICEKTHPKTLMTYLENQQRLCPKVEISCLREAINSVRITRGRNKGRRTVLKPTKCLMLSVGDVIEFDFYKGQELNIRTKNNNKSNNSNDSKTPSFVYRVVAFKSDRHNGNRQNIQSSKEKKQQRFQPSRRAKDNLDKTIDISFECDNDCDNDAGNLDAEFIEAPGVESPFVQQEAQSCEVEVIKSMKDENLCNDDQVLGVEVDEQQVQDQHLFSTNLSGTNSNGKAQMHEKELYSTAQITELGKGVKKNESQIQQETSPSVVDYYEDKVSQTKHEDEESDGESDFHDEQLNFSQDSFFESHLESPAQKQFRVQKPVEMPTMVSNYFWRALNSAEPQNGFGLLMHMGSVLNSFPNNSLARFISQYMLNGPMSDGAYFKDYRRTELTGIYTEFVMNRLKQGGCEIKFNIAPPSWADVQEMLSLPLTQTKDIKLETNNPQSIHYVAQALQQSSTSLKMIALNLELELKPAVESTDDLSVVKSLYNDQLLVKLMIKNQVRESLKTTVRLAARILIEHGHWLFGRLNEGRRICQTSEEELCAVETKSCLSSMGSLVSHLVWLYCVEEGVEFANQDCCLLIRDEIMAELDRMDFYHYVQSGKKGTAVAKRKLLSSLKLEFLLSLDTTFSQALQSKLGQILGLSSELTVLGM